MSTTAEFVNMYKGPKMAILVTGGGVNLASIAMAPGASRVLNSFFCPYATEETLNFIREYHPSPPSTMPSSMVSSEAARLLGEAMEAKFPDCNILVVTAACTTNRWRRGENQAFIACKSQYGVLEVWHLKVPKATEADYAVMTPNMIAQLREAEDDGISAVAMMLVLDPNHLLDRFRNIPDALTRCNS